jgi:uncharacterized protein
VDAAGGLVAGGEGATQLALFPSPRPSPHSHVLTESQITRGERGQRQAIAYNLIHTPRVFASHFPPDFHNRNLMVGLSTDHPTDRMTTELPIPMTRWQRCKSFRLRERVRVLISPEDSEHELALGTSVGVFVACTPLFGLHTVIILFAAFALQRLVRFNKALAVAACYVNNPVTFAPMLWASYQIGDWLVPAEAGEIQAVLRRPELDWHGGIRSLPSLLSGIGWPMLIGCLVLGTALAAAAYPMTYALVGWYRRDGAEVGPDVIDESAAREVAASAP